MSAKTYTLLGPDRRPYQSPTRGTLGGHRKCRIYGRLECPAALRAIARGRYVENRVFFADEQTAIAAGYRPCSACLTEKYARFRAQGSQMRGSASSGMALRGIASDAPPFGRSPLQA